jgi:hypothetical protein
MTPRHGGVTTGSDFMKRLSFTFCCIAGIISTGCSWYLPQGQTIQSEELRPYTQCTFADGLQIVALDSLPPGVTTRSVETATGKKMIPMLAGVRVMFAYPHTDFFANVKAERLPASQYPTLKRVLTDSFDYLCAQSPSFSINTGVGSLLHGLDVRGSDRDKLEGSTLGIYLIFDDNKQVVTTIYLLNQEPQKRKFQTMNEYRRLRDQFLSRYASCIAGKP